jgi:precorrin-3B synthase
MSVSDDRGRTTQEGGSPVLRHPPSVVRPLVRGVCPGLTAPMPTGDGLLVRLMPTGPIPLDAFIAFCTAARQHGNGTLEVSARGSLQVRGLTPQSAPVFASTVAALGIDAADGVAVIEIPLGNDAPDALVDTAGLAAELRRALAQTRPALAAKVSLVLDGGGRLHLDALSADVRLRAVGPADRPRLCIGLGGDGRSATWLGTIAPPRAPGMVVSFLKMIASHGLTARAADVVRTGGIRAFHATADIGIEPAPAPPPRLPAETIGLHPLRDGTLAVGIALAFGHAHADALSELARVAAAHGARSLRTAPGRTLLLVGVAAANAAAVASAAGQLGLVTQAFDPRRRIAACPGAPACASGLIPARALAAALASALATKLAPNPWPAQDPVTIHISGCSKGCAHPAPAALTVVGTERGCGIIRHGSARAAPRYHIDPADLAAEVARIVAESGEAAHG